MFKNKTLHVKLFDDSKSPKTDETNPANPPLDYVLIVREATELLAKNVIIGVGVYVAVDTLRQVIVKLTPSN